jgi:transcriptional regulator with XRE-family HTH domain
MATLGQFATAVGAPKRWVQNAFQALGLPAVYTEPLARRLAFAKAVKEACGMPLRRAFPLAGEALARWPAQNTWELREPDGAVRVVIDLERFLSDYAVRLSLSRTYYAEKRRGRPRKRKRRGIALAKWYGVDLSLLVESLKRTPEERLRQLDEAREFFATARIVR